LTFEQKFFHTTDTNGFMMEVFPLFALRRFLIENDKVKGEKSMGDSAEIDARRLFAEFYQDGKVCRGLVCGK
jgi:hypothetical protein